MRTTPLCARNAATAAVRTSQYATARQEGLFCRATSGCILPMRTSLGIMIGRITLCRKPRRHHESAMYPICFRVDSILSLLTARSMNAMRIPVGMMAESSRRRGARGCSTVPGDRRFQPLFNTEYFLSSASWFANPTTTARAPARTPAPGSESVRSSVVASSSGPDEMSTHPTPSSSRASPLSSRDWPRPRAGAVVRVQHAPERRLTAQVTRQDSKLRQINDELEDRRTPGARRVSVETLQADPRARETARTKVAVSRANAT